MKPALALLAVAGLALGACQQPAIASEKIVRAPVAERKAQESGKTATAIFAGGCFWGVEAVFSHVKGVKSAVSGYHGGNKATASYERVSAGSTAHEEAVRVTYDPSVIRYDQLVRIFFSVVANPTLKNNQGPDYGPQYDASLVPMNAEQRAVAAAYLAQMQKSGLWDKPIVTDIASYKAFFPAEDYHQDFAFRNPRHPYIVRWDAPKVRGLKELYPGVYRSNPVRD